MEMAGLLLKEDRERQLIVTTESCGVEKAGSVKAHL